MCTDGHVYNVVHAFNSSFDDVEAKAAMKPRETRRGRDKALSPYEYVLLTEYVQARHANHEKVSLKHIMSYTWRSFGIEISRATASRYRQDILTG